MRYALAAVMIATTTVSALAREDWNAKILKDCTSVEAQTCMLKPETRICEPSGKACRYIGIDNYVAVRKVMGSRILVDTVNGPATAPLSGLVTLTP